jgi:hypothetical protein
MSRLTAAASFNSTGGTVTTLLVLIGAGLVVAVLGGLAILALCLAAGGRTRGQLGPSSEARDHWPYGP